VVVGLLAEALTAAIESGALAARGVHVELTAGDYAQLLAGGAAAAALWAASGVGVGALVRNQVSAVVGLCVWLLLIETVLIGNVPSAGKFAPGPARARSPERSRRRRRRTSPLQRSACCCSRRTPAWPPAPARWPRSVATSADCQLSLCASSAALRECGGRSTPEISSPSDSSPAAAVNARSVPTSCPRKPISGGPARNAR
jgi:hypothetical protein